MNCLEIIRATIEGEEHLGDNLKKMCLDHLDNLQQKNQQISKGLYGTCLPYKTDYNKEVEKLKKQQQEFIKYLEDEIKHLEHSRYVSFNEFGEHKLMFYKEILLKYKEIIGGKK